jgi:hypothetical protein
MLNSHAPIGEPGWAGFLARARLIFRRIAPYGAQHKLVALMLARCVLASLFLLNVLPLKLRDGWFLYHEAGEEHIFELAVSISRGVPERSALGIAQPLVSVPWIALLKPESFADLALPLTLINGFFLGGLSVLVVGSMARYILNSDRLAFWTAAVWAFAPLLAYCGIFWHTTLEPAIVRSIVVPRLGWLDGLTDGPAAFFILLAVSSLARAVDRADKVTFWQMMGIGVATGVALIYRIQVASIAAFLVGYVLLVHGWQALLILCGTVLLVYLPQAWYNQVVFGFPITTGYVSYDDLAAWGGTLNRPITDILRNLPFSRENLSVLWHLTIGMRPWLVVPLTLALIVIVHAALLCWKEHGWQRAALLTGPPLFYLGFMMTTGPFRYDVLRFLVPVIPFMIIMGALIVSKALEQLPLSRKGVTV